MDILELIKIVVLGIVQGITEWLPISSTGHMILLDEFIKLNITPEFKEMFFVVIQLGSILAVVTIYFHKLNPFSLRKSVTERKETIRLWSKVIVAIIPAMIIGLLFDDIIDTLFYNYVVVALMLIIYGVLFIVFENRNKRSHPSVVKLSDITYKEAFTIGIFQVLALIPGTSRSGSTILGAMVIGLSRTIAAEFSFFLAIPVMAGASFLKVVKYIMEVGFVFTSNEIMTLTIGSLVAFVVSIFAIKFLMKYIQKNDFKAFGYYRIVLGILVFLYFILQLFI